MTPLAAHASTPAAICAQQGTNDTLRPIPENLVGPVNKAFGTAMPASYAMASTVYRCDGGHVWVCTIGANLPCGRANTSRVPGTGEEDWCRDNPNASFIPAVATGHDTIYAWRCQAGMPKIDRQLLNVDQRGFVGQYWKPLP